MDAVSLGCCLLAFLLYYNTLDAGFVYDDRRAILSNPDLLPTSSWWNLLQNDFWGTPLSDSGSHGSYRPLCVFSFRLNYLLGGLQPWGYHLVNVLLHVLATGLVVRVARVVLPAGSGHIGPAVAGLLFAVHPVHTEAVAGIVGRADLAACNFYLIAFLIYVLHVKYRDNSCVKAYPYSVCCEGRRVEKKLRKPCERKSCKLSTYTGSLATSKYHSFLVSLRNQVTSCYASPNEFCCMKHNVMLSALSFVGSSAFSVTGDHLRSVHFDSSGHHAANPSAAALSGGGGGGGAGSGNGGGFLGGCRCACGAMRDTTCWLRTTKQWAAFGGSVACATAAVLSKETGISVLVLCALYDLVQSPFKANHKRQLRSVTLLCVALCSLVSLRLHMAAGQTPVFATADNPTARAPSLLTRFLTFMYLPAFNFRLLVCPTVLSFDWSMDAIPRITSVCDSRNLVSLLFYGTLYKTIKFAVHKLKVGATPDGGKKEFKRASRSCRRRDIGPFMLVEPRYLAATSCPCQVCHHSLGDHHSASCRTNNNNNSVPSSHSMCSCPPPAVQQQRVSTRDKVKSPYATMVLACAFLALPFLPATNLFFYVGFVVAERVLYLPSVGYCLLVGLGASRLWRLRRYCCLCLAVVLVFFSLRTVRRNLDWRDEESLYRSAVHVNPPKAYGNLGSVLSSQGRTSEAEWAYNRALEHRANMADVHYNLGVLLQGRQDLEAAIRSYQRAIHFRPSLALAYVNLGGALVAAGRCQEAVAVLRQGSQLDGTGLKDQRTHETARVSALLQLGALYADQGRLHRALAAYREALHTMPQHYPPQSVYNLLGETLTRLQQFEEAERWYQAALQAQPDHVPAHITYGKLLAKNSSRVVEAEQWFRRAQRLAPTDPSVHHHFGEFLASLQRHAEAAVHYVQAAELKPQDYELVVAAATALRQADRRLDAEQWYRQAVQLRPMDARGHTNLGAILHLNGKYSEAAASYREALRLQPDDVTTLTNLHKLYSLMA